MSDRQSGGWGWFDSAPTTLPSAVSEAYRQCFATPSGRAVLRHLREMYLERRLGPDSSDAQLRYFEGARMVVAYIERQTDPDHPASNLQSLETIT